MEEPGEPERQPWLASHCGELSRENGGPLTPALVDDEEEGGGISGDDDVGPERAGRVHGELAIEEVEDEITTWPRTSGLGMTAATAERLDGLIEHARAVLARMESGYGSAPGVPG